MNFGIWLGYGGKKLKTKRETSESPPNLPTFYTNNP
jgi:hypothetical protein